MYTINTEKPHIDKKEYIGEFKGRIIILSEKDLKNIGFILCGQKVDIFIVPRKLTEREKRYLDICLIESKINKIIVI